jgi:hypothetical protein
MLKLFKNCKKPRKDDDDKIWGGVKFPNIHASNENKKRIMKPRKEEHQKYVMPKNQGKNITRVKRHKTCISLKSHKPWKA